MWGRHPETPRSRGRISQLSGRRHGRRAGLTLIEVCVALAVLAVATAGIYSLANMARRISIRARTHYLAVNLAKNHLERAKSRDFSQLSQFAESNTVVDVNGRLIANGEFRRSTSVSALQNGMRIVTVRIDIRDPYSGIFEGEDESVTQRLTEFAEKPK